MKTKIVLVVFFLGGLISLTAKAGLTVDGPKTAQPVVKSNGKEIEWLSIEEAQKRMKKQPRKVMVDVFTNWCGWCKHMDATTFRDPSIVDYVNKNYYAVKLNAETRDTITFMGEKYFFKPEMKANEFAVNLLQGKMGYPTVVYLDEEYKILSPVSGFQQVDTETMILKFFGDNHYKTTAWDKFQESYAKTIKEGTK